MHHPINRAPTTEARHRIDDATARIAYCILQMSDRDGRNDDRMLQNEELMQCNGDRTVCIADHTRRSTRPLTRNAGSRALRPASIEMHRASHTILEDNRRADQGDHSAGVGQATTPHRQSVRANRKPHSLQTRAESLRHSSHAMTQRSHGSHEPTRTTTNGMITWPVSHRHKARCECHPLARRRAAGGMP